MNEKKKIIYERDPLRDETVAEILDKGFGIPPVKFFNRDSIKNKIEKKKKKVMAIDTNIILKEKNVVEWFNPHDINHINAYKEHQQEGNWPKDFIPKEIKFSDGWFYNIGQKIIQCWIEYVKKESLKKE